MSLAEAIEAQKRQRSRFISQALEARAKKISQEKLSAIIELLEKETGIEKITERCNCGKDTVYAIKQIIGK